MIAGSVAVSAQPPQARSPKTPEERAELHAKRMQERLQLTNAQYEEVYALHLSYVKERETKRKEMQTFLKESVKQEDEQLAKVLTAEQQQQWEEMKATRKEQMKKRRAGH